MAIVVTKSNNKEWIGYTIMIILFILAIYIGVKHYKSPGFWYGILVIVLLGITVKTGNDPSFDSAILSISKGKS